MKTTCWLLIGFIFSCCQGQENEISQPFTFNKAAGLWVPYELKYDDNLIVVEELYLFDFFAVYMGSVKLNADGTYNPFLWTDKGNYQFSEEESGICELTNNQLSFRGSGSWQIDFKVSKFTDDELWLRGTNYLVKFRKKP
jgi:hypothetical protein